MTQRAEIHVDKENAKNIAFFITEHISGKDMKNKFLERPGQRGNVSDKIAEANTRGEIIQTSAPQRNIVPGVILME